MVQNAADGKKDVTRVNAGVSIQNSRLSVTVTNWFSYCAFQYHADSKIQSSTDKCMFATVNQMFGGSSQPPTTAERAVIKSLSMHSSDIETVLGTFKRRE